jgi:hypothetical protein
MTEQLSLGEIGSEDVQARGHAGLAAHADTPARLDSFEELPANLVPGRAKFTFYFSESDLIGIDQIWYRLRRASPRDRRGKLTKSFVVRAAVEELMRRYRENPAETIVQLQRKAEQQV